jgi:hypothetical protein
VDGKKARASRGAALRGSATTPLKPTEGLNGPPAELVISSLAATITNVIEHYSTAYPAKLFKNASKCKDLKTRVIVSLSDSPAQGTLNLSPVD